MRPRKDGVTLALSAAAASACGAAQNRVREQLFDLLEQGLPVAISVEELGPADRCAREFGRICEILRSAAEQARSDPGRITIVVEAGTLEPARVWSLRLKYLGRGPVFLRMNARSMRSDDLWSQCWRLRGIADLQLLLAPAIYSPCPLLSAESARGVLPGPGLQVPAGSAWIPLRLNVRAFANDRGELDVGALHARARHCVEQGEAAHRSAVWPNAALRHDAWLNRRLAIELQGIGDLVLRQQRDPACFKTLQTLDAMLRALRHEIVAHSKALATSAGHLEALDAANPCRGPSNAVVQLNWQQRWRKALDTAAIRHRNLLAMSPWSVFPCGKAADRRYVDLLPVLRHADVAAFPRPPSLHHWNINEFKNFHSRAWAILQQKDAIQLIAEQV